MTGAMDWPEALPLAIEILGIEDIELLFRYFGVIRQFQVERSALE